jgi:hypothetical protein
MNDKEPDKISAAIEKKYKVVGIHPGEVQPPKGIINKRIVDLRTIDMATADKLYASKKFPYLELVDEKKTTKTSGK